MAKGSNKKKNTLNYGIERPLLSISCNTQIPICFEDTGRQTIQIFHEDLSIAQPQNKMNGCFPHVILTSISHAFHFNFFSHTDRDSCNMHESMSAGSFERIWNKNRCVERTTCHNPGRLFFPKMFLMVLRATKCSFGTTGRIKSMPASPLFNKSCHFYSIPTGHPHRIRR